jgi:hypothetical protein
MLLFISTFRFLYTDCLLGVLDFFTLLRRLVYPREDTLIPYSPSTMPVPTFNMPRSLNEAVVGPAPAAPKDDEAGNRSKQSAKESTKSFPVESREPLATHKANHKPGITFAHEDKLPKLPIPDLEGSIKKYLAALKPLQGGREHEETILAVHEFLRAEGPELQERLKKYAGGKTSYIEQFCKVPRHIVIGPEQLINYLIQGTTHT